MIFAPWNGDSRRHTNDICAGPLVCLGPCLFRDRMVDESQPFGREQCLNAAIRMARLATHPSSHLLYAPKSWWPDPRVRASYETGEWLFSIIGCQPSCRQRYLQGGRKRQTQVGKPG